MQLPPALEDAYWQQVLSYEVEQKMAYVTSAERRGIKQGIEQGIEQGFEQAAVYLRRMLLEILEKNEDVTAEQRSGIAEKVEQISEIEALSELGSLAIEDDGLDGFYARLDELTAQVERDE